MASDNTAVARAPKPLAPEVQARIQDAKEKNAIVKAIRATLWGSNLPDAFAGAVAEYCRVNQLDAVRHVEILGGRIYLTAEFYIERGAFLMRSGEIEPADPEYINVDERLEKLAKDGTEWAVAERDRRLEQRIRWNVPEGVKAAVVQRLKIKSSGRDVVGVNWCGGTQKKDPVGEAEPTKTAATRALRRAWKQIADVIPAYGAIVNPVEASAKIALPVHVVDAPDDARKVGNRLSGTADPYALNAGETVPAERTAESAEAEPVATK